MSVSLARKHQVRVSLIRPSNASAFGTRPAISFWYALTHASAVEKSALKLASVFSTRPVPDPMAFAVVAAVSPRLRRSLIENAAMLFCITFLFVQLTAIFTSKVSSAAGEFA